MRSALTAVLLFSLLLAACGDAGGGADEPAANSKAVQAAAIADEIATNPDRMEEILAAHSMTADEFESLLFEISEDEALSDAYEKARKVRTPE
jgi:hypothetical protein